MGFDATPQRYLMGWLMGARQLPPVLYHYTTPDGLRGILGSRRLWATHVRYLNDSSEFQYTLVFAQVQLARYAGTCADYRLKKLNDEWVRAIRIAGRDHYYALSFSAERDLLSQWRAYGRAGYALGFDEGHLFAVAAAFDGRAAFVPCIYDLAQQHSVWNHATEYLRQSFLERCEAEGEATQDVVDEFAAHFYSFVTVLSTSFKHPAFSQESEWRLVFEGPDPAGRDPDLRRRAGVGGTVPYLEIPIGTDDPQLPLFRVDIAPDAPPVAEEFLASVLEGASISVRYIERSSIPLRSD